MRQAHGVDHPLIREIELSMKVEMRPGNDRAMANRFEQLRPAHIIFLAGKLP